MLLRLAIKLAVNNIVDLPDCHASGPLHTVTPLDLHLVLAAARTPALPRPVAAGLPLGAWALSLSEMPLALAVRGASLGIPVSSRLLTASGGGGRGSRPGVHTGRRTLGPDSEPRVQDPGGA